MRILAIDPGPEESAYVIYDAAAHTVTEKMILDNGSLLAKLEGSDFWVFNRIDRVAIEMIASYGMPVGRSVFETVFWVGQFFHEASRRCPPVRLVYRKEETLHLCNSNRASDANVRHALIDLFGNTKAEAIGTKKQPGPLYGVKKDMWQALAVAVTAAETR